MTTGISHSLREFQRVVAVVVSVLFAVALLLTPGIATGNTTNNTLNGVGEFTELGQRVFIATLSTPQPTSDARALLSQNQPATMQMRITVRRMSQRRFITLWLESVTVNAESSKLLAHSGDFTRFSNLFHGALRAGDLLTLDYQPNNGLAVSLNNVELGGVRSTQAGEFFRLLLSGWIGEIPLSTQFREALLSPESIDARMLAEFDALTFAEDRQAAVRAWLLATAGTGTTAARTNVAQTPAGGTALPAATGAQPAKKPALESKPKVKTPSSTVAGSDPVNAVARVETTPPAGQKPAGGVQTANSPKVHTTAASQLKQAATLQPQQSLTGSDEDEADLAAEDDTLAIDEQSLLIRQQYYSRVSNAALKYQTLPRKAFQRRIEGDVRVMVTLDRNGQVISTQLAEASRHEFLNQQALSAIHDAAPFPPIPAELAGEQFAFTVPFRYRLPY